MVRLERDPPQPHPLKPVPQLQQLYLRIHPCPAHLRRQPRPTELRRPVLSIDVRKSRTSDHSTV